MNIKTAERFILMDTHVHLYPAFDQSNFFESAWDHFEKIAKIKGLPANTLYSLFFTETAKEDYFHHFQRWAEQPQKEGWKFYKTEESYTLIAKDNKRQIVIVAGHQMATKEKLEVLALGCSTKIEDGKSFSDTISEAANLGAIPVIPWCFGKWWGKRGKIVKEYVLQEKEVSFLLGDNGGRPNLFKFPSHFELAKRRSIPVILGSDPLPFDSQEFRVAKCGVIGRGEVDLQKPGSGLKQVLMSMPSDPAFYGDRESVIDMIVNQIRMQIRKI